MPRKRKNQWAKPLLTIFTGRDGQGGILWTCKQWSPGGSGSYSAAYPTCGRAITGSWMCAVCEGIETS